MRKAAAQLEGQGDLLADKKVDEVVNNGAQQEPDIDVSVEGDPVVEAKKTSEKKDDEPTVEGLQKQLEELKNAEKVNKETNARLAREREEAIAQQRRFEAEAMRHQSDTAQAQLDAIDAALGSAKAEAESAERDLEMAIAQGDVKAQADAARRISRSESNIGRLEDGKGDLEYRVKSAMANAERARNAPQVQRTDAVDALNVPERAKDWLREHRDFVDDARKNLKLQSAHFDALDEGHKEFSTDYFISLEKLLGLRKADKVEKITEDNDDEIEDNRGAIVSAPVNRESSGGGNADGGGSRRSVRLTKDQQEAARISGVTDKVYAENLLRLDAEKKNGNYGERR